jgi:hypothetical protein
MMAKLFIAEYANFAAAPNHLIQAPLEPPLVEQVIDFTSGPAVSNPFRPLTRMVRLNCDATCSLLIGADPTANADSGRMPADTVEFRGIPEGSAFKISVVSNA